ncbi:hypothetical protein [Leucobacter sp. gxy201]|uniref:hypothetical protein n=1 Tax=Leucobacter sp. gxy201 TaxID=2957200 RepID=UPI003DA11479
MLRLLFFIGLGFVLGGGVAALIGPPGAGSWGFAVGLPVAISSGVLVLVGRSLSGVQMPSAQMIDAAIEAGRGAAARVDVLRQTGTQINDQPLCELELTVQPHSGSAFRTTMKRIVAVTEIPAFQPGSVHEAVLLVDGGPDVALVPGSARPIADALHASPVVPDASDAGPLLVPEPGLPTAGGGRRRPLIGIGRTGRPLRIAAFVIAALVAAAVVVLPYRGAVVESVAALRTTGQLHADLREGAPLERAIGELERSIGHGSIVNATVSDDLITVEAAVVPGEQETDDWSYRRGVVKHSGPALIQPDDADEQFLLSDVDWRSIERALDQARVLAELPDADRTIVSVRRTTDHDVHSESFARQIGPVEIALSVENDYHSAWFRMNADGSDLEMTSRD